MSYSIIALYAFSARRQMTGQVKQPPLYQHNRPTGIQALPFSQHISDVAPVIPQHELRDLILGHPLEVLEVLDVSAQVGLSCHDPALHEEGLFAEDCSAGLVGLGLSGVVDVVADGVVANHPGVHVDSGGLCKGTLSGLSSINVRYGATS